MKILGLFFFLTIFFLGNVFAECSDEQININTASAEDLDKITYVGPATAAKIISARPFDSVDDLINVSGIGETKLKAIKDENLACVENSRKEKEDEESSEENIKENLSTSIQGGEIETTIQSKNLTPKTVELEVIKLNSKDIKTIILFKKIKKEFQQKNMLVLGSWLYAF